MVPSHDGVAEIVVESSSYIVAMITYYSLERNHRAKRCKAPDADASFQAESGSAADDSDVHIAYHAMLHETAVRSRQIMQSEMSIASPCGM